MKYETEIYISIPLLTKEQEELHFCCHVQLFAAQRVPNNLWSVGKNLYHCWITNPYLNACID